MEREIEIMRGMIVPRCQTIGKRRGVQCGHAAKAGSAYCKQHQSHAPIADIGIPISNEPILIPPNSMELESDADDKKERAVRWNMMLAHAGGWLLSNTAMKN